MAKTVNASEAKARLSELMAEAAYGGEQIVIQRRGKPFAALVSIADFQRLVQGPGLSKRPRGALALAGIWKDVGDKKINRFVADVYARRTRDKGRRVRLEL